MIGFPASEEEAIKKVKDISDQILKEETKEEDFSDIFRKQLVR